MILKNIKAVFLSNIIIQVIGFISSFILKRLIVPSLMGIWNLANIITSYIQMFDLGTSGALQRQMPYYLGGGNLEMEEKVRETHFAVVFIETGLASLIFLVFFFLKGNFLAVCYWFLYLLVPFYALSNRIYSCMIDCFQARQQFVKLSKQNVYVSIVGVFLTIIGGWIWGITGLFLGFTLLYAFRIWLAMAMAKHFGLNFTVKFHPAVFKELFKIGFPMQISSYLWRIFVTIDSVLTTKWLGVTQLAFYSIGVGFKNQLGEFPVQINTIFYQRMMKIYSKENNLKSIAKEIITFFQGNLLVVVPFVCLSGLFILPFIIASVIKNYTPAIAPVIILLFTLFFAPQSGILLNILTLKKALKTLIFVSAVALLINFSCIYILNLRERSIVNVALGTLIGNAVFFVFLFFISTTGVLDSFQKIKIILFEGISLSFTAVVFFTLEAFFPISQSWVINANHVFFKFIVSLILCIPLAIFGLKISGSWGKVRKEIFSTLSSFGIRVRSTTTEDI